MALQKDKLTGVWPAFPTPTTPSGELDEKKLVAVVEYLIAGGASGLVPVGGTGEYTALSPQSRAKVVATTVAAAKGRVPVAAGVLSPGYAEARDAGIAFKDAGADAVMLITPFYVRPTQHGIRDYFKRYREDVDAPILLYDIPYRTQSIVDADTIAAMACDDRTIIGMKACNADLAHFSRTVAQTAGAIAIMSGEDGLFPSHLAIGASGGILATASIIPSVWVEIFRLIRSNKPSDALTIHRKLYPLMDAIFCEANPGPLKEAMRLIGLDVGSVLLPLQKPSAATIAKIERELDSIRQNKMLHPKLTSAA